MASGTGGGVDDVVVGKDTIGVVGGGVANERDGAAKEGGKGHEEAVIFAGVAGRLCSGADRGPGSQFVGVLGVEAEGAGIEAKDKAKDEAEAGRMEECRDADVLGSGEAKADSVQGTAAATAGFHGTLA